MMGMLLLTCWIDSTRADPIEPKEVKFPKHYYLKLTENNTYKINGRYNTNSEQLYAFEKEGADNLSEIFIYYEILYKRVPKLKLELELEKQKSNKLQLKIESLKKSNEYLELALDLMRNDRDLYKNALKSQEKNDKLLEKKKKTVFVISITGTAVGALAVGIIIGAFILR